MKNSYLILLSLLFSSECSLASSSEGLTIYKAKEIVTLDQTISSADSVLISNDRVLAISSIKDLKDRYPEASINDQFKNDVMVPGFIEHHIHPFLSAITMNAEIIAIEGWNLPNNQSQAYRDRDSYLKRLSDIEEKMKDDKPLVTWGFHHYFHGDLDLISSERPILVMHRSYHEFILNTPALEYFDITRDFVESLDEEARMYADFDKGHFSEQGMISVYPKLLKYLGRPEYLLSGLQLTEDYLHQNGVTMIANPGAWLIEPIQKAKNLILGDENTPFRSFFIPSALILSEEHEVSELIEESKKLLDWGEGKVEYLPNRIKLFAETLRKNGMVF